MGININRYPGSNATQKLMAAQKELCEQILLRCGTITAWSNEYSNPLGATVAFSTEEAALRALSFDRHHVQRRPAGGPPENVRRQKGRPDVGGHVTSPRGRRTQSGGSHGKMCPRLSAELPARSPSPNHSFRPRTPRGPRGLGGVQLTTSWNDVQQGVAWAYKNLREEKILEDAPWPEIDDLSHLALPEFRLPPTVKEGLHIWGIKEKLSAMGMAKSQLCWGPRYDGRALPSDLPRLSFIPARAPCPPEAASAPTADLGFAPARAPRLGAPYGPAPHLTRSSNGPVFGVACDGAAPHTPAAYLEDAPTRAPSLGAAYGPAPKFARPSNGSAFSMGLYGAADTTAPSHIRASHSAAFGAGSFGATYAPAPSHVGRGSASREGFFGTAPHAQAPPLGGPTHGSAFGGPVR